MDALTLAADRRDTTVDLRGLTFIDSCGIRLLIDLHLETGRNGFSLRLLRGSAAVQRPLVIAGIDSVMDIVDAED